MQSYARNWTDEQRIGRLPSKAKEGTGGGKKKKNNNPMLEMIHTSYLVQFDRTNTSEACGENGLREGASFSSWHENCRGDP
jgi:hypothetical protein